VCVCVCERERETERERERERGDFILPHCRKRRGCILVSTDMQVWLRCQFVVTLGERIQRNIEDGEKNCANLKRTEGEIHRISQDRTE
jgi:hypothetical protein